MPFELQPGRKGDAESNDRRNGQRLYQRNADIRKPSTQLRAQRPEQTKTARLAGRIPPLRRCLLSGFAPQRQNKQAARQERQRLALTLEEKRHSRQADGRQDREDSSPEALLETPGQQWLHLKAGNARQYD